MPSIKEDAAPRRPPGAAARAPAAGAATSFGSIDASSRTAHIVACICSTQLRAHLSMSKTSVYLQHALHTTAHAHARRRRTARGRKERPNWAGRNNVHFVAWKMRYGRGANCRTLPPSTVNGPDEVLYLLYCISRRLLFSMSKGPLPAPQRSTLNTSSEIPHLDPTRVETGTAYPLAATASPPARTDRTRPRTRAGCRA